MQFDFPEYNPGLPLKLAPIRNPLAEVRWKSFLRGDAYVNPFHDLLYALARPAAKSQPTEERVPRARRFLIDATGIRALHGGEVDETWSWADIRELKVEFAPELLHQSQSEGHASWSSARLGFRVGEERVDLRIRAHRDRCASLCQFLLDQKIPFREFAFGTRSFLMKTGHKYAEIQRIKREHGIEW